MCTLFLVGASMACGLGDRRDDQGDDGSHDDGGSGGYGEDGPGDCDYCNVPRPRALRLNLEAAVGLAIVSGENADAGAVAPSSGVLRFDGPKTRAGMVLTSGRAVQKAEDGTSPDGTVPADEDADPADGTGDPDEGTEEEEDTLLKLDEDGELVPALEPIEVEGMEELPPEALEQMWDAGPLPRVTALGLSPDGSVYVLFERPFVYRTVDPEDADEDIWSGSSPYTCQLFRSEAGWDPQGDGAAAGDLHCVTNQHEIPTWQRDRVMQFDADGNLYFPAVVPGSWQQVFYAYDPAADELSEKVNANICWYDVEVTPRGSIFYTGASSTDGDCSGTSFFRYVSGDNRLTEIARDWWDFKYVAEQDPSNPDNERIIFYGPDPNSDDGYGWESACIYRYDPSTADLDARTTRLTECGYDGWGWIYGDSQSDPSSMTASERAVARDRCNSEGDIFVSGEGVSSLDQADDGTVFVAGAFQRKLAAVFTCELQISVDHCDTLDPSHDTEGACTTAGGSWQNVEGACEGAVADNETDCFDGGGTWIWGVGTSWYSQIEGSACLATDDPDEAAADDAVVYAPGWEVGWTNCEGMGGEPNTLTQQISGLAYLDTSGDGLGSIELLSDPDEDVEGFWPVVDGDVARFYYSVYDRGSYSLRVASVEDGEVVRRTLLSDYEVYNVHRDPSSPARVLFDGLYFANNSYLFGSIDPSLGSPEEVLASLELVEGVTGQIETLIILPDF